MSLSDYLNGPKYKVELERLSGENATLKRTLDELDGLTLLAVREKIDSAERELAARLATCATQASALESLKMEYEDKSRQVLVVEETLLLESFALYLPKFDFATSDEYKSRLDDVREQQKRLIKAGDAAVGGQGWTVNNSAAQGRKLVGDMMKLLIRAFNNECDYCVDNVKFNNIELNERRINQSFDALNKLGRIMHVEISNEYKTLKLDELRLAHEYQIKKQQEKEAQKKAREELREQQKLEQEIRAARDRIAKERRHFKVALAEVESRLVAARGTPEETELAARVADLASKVSELDKEEKVIDYREQNAKAGYVYIISNIGAFGEGVFKIGMTRRLEPMERIDELSDASVPFSFDVHALLFSENAPLLESKLHEHFYGSRVNKLNDRKEFFYAHIDEIERIIKDSYDKVVEVRKDAPAEEYRESILLTRASDSGANNGQRAA